MKITDRASKKQARQLLAIKSATDKKRAEVEALMKPPSAAPPTATEIQAAEILRINRKWDQDRDIGDRLRGDEPERRGVVHPDHD